MEHPSKRRRHLKMERKDASARYFSLVDLRDRLDPADARCGETQVEIIELLATLRRLTDQIEDAREAQSREPEREDQPRGTATTHVLSQMRIRTEPTPLQQ